MIESQDQLLVKQCLCGDRSAFGLLVDKYQKPVFNLALRMVQDSADAKDVSQAAFVKAFEKLGSFDPQFKFFSWLYRIAVNEALTFLDHRKRFSPLQEEMEGEGKPQQELSEERDHENMITAALKELSPDHRAVIVLKHLEELSYEEVGKILNIPPKKVKSRLFSARLALRDVFARKGITRND